MFDLWARDTEITALIAIFAVLIILPIQLFLCFRAKKLLVKLLPAILLVVAVIAFYTLIFVIKDRSAIGYGILAIVSEVLLFFSGIAWGIWAIAKLIQKKSKRRHTGEF